MGYLSASYIEDSLLHLGGMSVGESREDVAVELGHARGSVSGSLRSGALRKYGRETVARTIP